MSYVVAVAGPAAGAKSVVAAMLVGMLRDAGTKPVLVVDADPAMRLAGLLGASPGRLISEMLDTVVRDEGTAKELLVEQYVQQDCITEGKGFDLVTMGNPGGLEAHCYLRSVFHGVLAKFKMSYRACVIDCDAHFEFVHGMGADDIDRLVVVSDSPEEATETLLRARDLPVAVRKRVLIQPSAGNGVEGFDEVLAVPGITDPQAPSQELQAVLP